MTPDELRKLADEASPGPWDIHPSVPLHIGAEDEEGRWVVASAEPGGEADARLIALAPDLARLCAELAELVQYVRDGMCGHISGECINRTDAALAKLSELNTGADEPPARERT